MCLGTHLNRNETLKIRQNRSRFIYTHFKSCDQSLDKTSFDFSDIFRAMQSFSMSTKSSTILKIPKSMVKCLKWVKQTYFLTYGVYGIAGIFLSVVHMIFLS